MTELANEPEILRSDVDGICTLTLNRPKARNALSVAMIGQLQAQIDAIRENSAIRAVIITGSGPAFCAGHDMSELVANPTRAFYDEIFSTSGKMMKALIGLPQPVIAKIHGIATAAGCQLVATCDLAVASTEAKFATPGVHLGLFCSTPMVPLSRNVGRKAAMEMLLLGEMVPAERAVDIGLINRAVPADALDAEVEQIARQLASKSTLTLKIGKEAFYKQLEKDIDEAYAYASEVMATNMTARDAEEGVSAFMEKREPVWRNE